MNGLSEKHEQLRIKKTPIFFRATLSVAIAGIDHVGIGSDFDGIEVTPEGVENISKTLLVLEEMRRRGYSEKDILKVSGQNLLAVWNRIVNCSE